MGKLSFYARKRIVNLHLLGINISQIVWKLTEEDGIIASRPAVSLFLSRFKRTGSLYNRPRKGRNPKLGIRQFDVIDEEMKKNDELYSVELQRILLARCNITVSAQTIRRVWRRLGWTWSGTKYCQLIKDVNKPKCMEHCLKIPADGDDSSDVIFSDECSVKIERSTRRCFHKVGEPRRTKGQPKHPLKVGGTGRFYTVPSSPAESPTQSKLICLVSTLWRIVT